MSLNYLDFKGITKNEKGEFDGIDVLVAMARQGKIDPWAVDIVEVADMFSTHLFQSKAYANPHRQQRNLQRKRGSDLDPPAVPLCTIPSA